MKQQLIVLHYSQLSGSDVSLSIKAFADKTQKSTKEIGDLVAQQMRADGAIHDFILGKINESQFVQRMNNVLNDTLGVETPLTHTEFINCWNAMCVIKNETLEFLKDLEHLQKKFGFKLLVICNSNETQHQFISDKLAKAGVKLDLEYKLSFKEGSLLNKQALAAYEGEFEVQNLMDVKAQDDILIGIRRLNPGRAPLRLVCR